MSIRFGALFPTDLIVVLTADAGAFVLTGSAAGLRASRKLTASVGTFALTGVAARTLVGRRVFANVGTLALTGNAANLIGHIFRENDDRTVIVTVYPRTIVVAALAVAAAASANRTVQVSAESRTITADAQ